ncbi:gliding motility-associated ABC transporter ATP-binding subunit GldA [Fulvitalea axinellae]|uniref:Gliding motility-associated ABC transporter ATP-binding subunit GldA n=1 Tax=Fulvitalea axinellae TaxID=1182444 RepID=A0AAU9CIM4_9BACT|nr:gliding motility-associated ABC transporter ATP-binding subunit GldA [Fulvitalea axinellae]
MTQNNPTSSIEVIGITKIYGSQTAVNNVSFNAQKGEVLGFLGPNGAGKSTTMKISTGYVSPTKGTVMVCGYDIQQAPVEAKRHIGYLPENNPLYYDMYVREYLAFAGSVHSLKGQNLNKQVKKVIGLCGLGREQNKKIGMLSKGYKQRVGLAQALIHDPSVLILDEPTTGLDPNQLSEIRSLIKDISTDKTVILSTHIMQEVEAMCDRTVIINRGKIVADQSIAELKGSFGAKRYTVEFTSEVNLDKLRSISPEISAESIGERTFNISSASLQDIREMIFDFAVANGTKLIGLTEEPNSMEDIFRRLTDRKESQSN